MLHTTFEGKILNRKGRQGGGGKLCSTGLANDSRLLFQPNERGKAKLGDDGELDGGWRYGR